VIEDCLGPKAITYAEGAEPGTGKADCEAPAWFQEHIAAIEMGAGVFRRKWCCGAARAKDAMAANPGNRGFREKQADNRRGAGEALRIERRVGRRRPGRAGVRRPRAIPRLYRPGRQLARTCAFLPHLTKGTDEISEDEDCRPRPSAAKNGKPSK